MDNYKITSINYEEHYDDLKLFFESYCGSSANTFTYFQKRTYDVIKNHLITNIIYLNNKPCGYSHLEKDGENIWFGICIGESFKGKKLGEALIKKTLEQALEKNVSSVVLSVYKENIAAIKLYEKVGFIKTHENNVSFFMKKEF